MAVPTAPQIQPGMGSIPHPGGTTFRVWAPHAEKVYVAGTFNDWSETACALSPEENGYWAADVPGAKPGDEYRYLLHTAVGALWRNDPYARELTHSGGNSIIVDPHFDWTDEDFQMPAWNEMVIYEMHVGTFNTKGNDQPGTFETAIEKLAYLKDLGINVLQMMPPTEFPGGFSWGYNPAQPFALESAYGGEQAFREFVNAAHGHGIAVIVDVVYNHFGPGDLDLWKFDGWSENDLGGIYFYNDWRSETPWGHTRPDYGRDEVRQYLRDNALHWLEEYHVDGLRWDATAYIRNVHGNDDDPSNDLPDGWSLMQWIHEEIQARQPWKITIAEDLKGNEWITRDVGAGGAGFSAQWETGFVHPVRQAIITTNDQDRDLEAVRAALQGQYNGDAFERVIYTESHDEVANGRARVPEEIWPGNVGSWFSRKRSTLGAALTLTAPGIPMLFQGQEFLEDRWFHDQDPLEWYRQREYSGLGMMYRSLIHLRRNINNESKGLTGNHIDIFHLNQEAKVIAYQRWYDGGPRDSVVVVANMADRVAEGYVIGLPREGQWKVRFNSDWQGFDPEFGAALTLDLDARPGETDGYPFYGALSIGPYSVVILSQDE